MADGAGRVVIELTLERRILGTDVRSVAHLDGELGQLGGVDSIDCTSSDVVRHTGRLRDGYVSALGLARPRGSTLRHVGWGCKR